MRDNTYDVRVYERDEDDERVDLLQRAMHAELCRLGKNGLHSGGHIPQCRRARDVAIVWTRESEPA